ncbi:MAG: DPP IV N-terminal domain-containing protein, partial [Chitinophagaceae bacterium]
MKNKITLLVIALGCTSVINAQQALTQYKPTHDQIIKRYKEMVMLDSVARNSVFKTNVIANWQSDGNGFWYRNTLKDSVINYIYADAAKGTKQSAFDHAQLAKALGEVAGKTIDATRMQLSNLAFDMKNRQLVFRYDRKWWQCDLTKYTCTSISTPADTLRNTTNPRSRPRWERDGRRDSLSLDKQWSATIKEYNVVIRSVSSGETIQFTNDGTKEKPYGQLTWSPDSKYIVGYKIDLREDKEVYYILSSSPNTTRGVLKSNRYAQPGDEFTSYEMFVFNLASKQSLKVNSEKYDFLGSPWLRWSKTDNRYFTYEKADRGHQRFRVIE